MDAPEAMAIFPAGPDCVILITTATLAPFSNEPALLLPVSMRIEPALPTLDTVPERRLTEPELPAAGVTDSTTTDPERAAPTPDFADTIPLVPLEKELPETRFRDPPTVLVLPPDVNVIWPPVCPTPAVINKFAAWLVAVDPAVPNSPPEVSTADSDFIVIVPDENPVSVTNAAVPEVALDSVFIEI